MSALLANIRKHLWEWITPLLIVLVVAMFAVRSLGPPFGMFLPLAAYLLYLIALRLLAPRVQDAEARNGLAIESPDDTHVNGLPLPPLLVQLMRTGNWRNPGDDVMQAAIPFLNGPVDFLPLDQMTRESHGTLADFPLSSMALHELRGSQCPTPVELPWLDVDKAVFIAADRLHGGDLAIVLDYRTGLDEPRVVASEWLAPGSGCVWREVAPSFHQFARMMQWHSDET
jgi:hypothetical protein